MIRKELSIIAAAVFAALSAGAIAQTRQSTDASQASQTNPTQIVNPSAATGQVRNLISNHLELPTMPQGYSVRPCGSPPPNMGDTPCNLIWSRARVPGSTGQRRRLRPT